MARKSSYLMGELAALLDTYISLMSQDIEPTVANCALLLLDSSATVREAKLLLTRFRVLISRQYDAAHWKMLGIVRPSVFYRVDEDGYTFFMTRGQRGVTSYD